MEETRLIYLDGLVPSIYFPAGTRRKGGTCDFATKTCLKNCPSYLAPNKAISRVFEFFEKNNSQIIAETIIEQLDSLFGVNLLQWFCWGDCPKVRTEKISEIIRLLSDNGIVQCGFTRNERLWRNCLKIKNINIGLTIEEKRYRKIRDLYGEDKYNLIQDGLVGVPNYSTGVVKLYWGTDRARGGCSGVWYTSPLGIESQANCMECYEKKEGCFSQWDGDNIQVREVNRFELIDL